MKLIKKANIAALPFTGTEPCIYWGERGLGCRVYESGRKVWVLNYRASSRKRLFTIGEFPDMSQTTAEDTAASYRLQIMAGGDPAWEKRLTSKATSLVPTQHAVGAKTVGALCDMYLALHASKKRSARDDERLLERFVRPAWAKLRADSLTRQQIAMQHANISMKTPVQANRVLAVLKAMMNNAALGMAQTQPSRA